MRKAFPLTRGRMVLLEKEELEQLEPEDSRDIEVTRERMSSTLIQLEQKMNLTQVVKDHPWPSLAIAVGAGLRAR